MIYCISDIHGEYELFVRLMDKIAFSASDELYVCGDIIDKGDESVRLAKLLFAMSNVHCVMGNHEHAFLRYYTHLMECEETENYDNVLQKLQSYIPGDGCLLDWETVDKFESLPYYIDTEKFICVHAGVPLDKDKRMLPIEKATPEQLIYDRTFKEPKAETGAEKCIFFGHTPTSYIAGKADILAYQRQGKAGNIIDDYYKVHLDTGTTLNGVIGCFCVDTCRDIYVKKEFGRKYE